MLNKSSTTNLNSSLLLSQTGWSETQVVDKIDLKYMHLLTGTLASWN